MIKVLMPTSISLHTGGVAGSIPASPTSNYRRLQEITGVKDQPVLHPSYTRPDLDEPATRKAGSREETYQPGRVIPCPNRPIHPNNNNIYSFSVA